MATIFYFIFKLFVLDSEATHGAVKNLFTLTTSTEIRIEFFKFGLGMYLVPIFLSLTIGYVIVALQFNNVI